MEIRAPHPHEVAAVLTMLTRAYRSARPDFPDDPAVLGAYAGHDPDGPERWVVAFDRDRPVSALRLFYRDASSPSGPIRFGGIGNVGTDPDQGGRGLASAVMRAAHDRLRADGIGTALLITDIPEFYARLGYVVVEQPERRLTRSATVALGHAALPMPSASAVSPGATAAPGTALFPPVPAGVAAAHRAAAASVPGRVLRTDELWNRWILTFKRRGGIDAVHAGDAYLMGRSEEAGTSYRVFEAAGDPSAVLRLLEPRLGPKGHRRDGVGVLKLPDDPLGRAITDALGGEVAIRIRTGIMAAALAPGAPGAEAFAGFLELDAF
jgi:predicted N-acetyltransferase YhbS